MVFSNAVLQWLPEHEKLLPALLSLVAKGSLQAAIFRTDDLDATFEKVRASGAEVLQEPAAQPWGARDCAFRDPSGNLVRIAQA